MNDALNRLLAAVVLDPTNEASFLNTLSLLEYVGACKINRAVGDRHTVAVLDHAADEARHALAFKQLADAVAGGRHYGYLARDAALRYFSALDHTLSAWLAGNDALDSWACYLVVTAAVERRAMLIYPVLRRHSRHPRVVEEVKRIISEEASHKVAIEKAAKDLLISRALDWDTVLDQEQTLFDALLNAMLAALNEASPRAKRQDQVIPSQAETLTRGDVRQVFHQNLLELVLSAAAVHREHHDPSEVQCSSLLSIKTGACPEDCAYCSQSSRHDNPAKRQALLSVDEVVHAARSAQARGADRFCMGAAWRQAKGGESFEQVLEMVRQVRALGLETCVTLGMLNDDQAARLKEAGLDYYNHNLDTSPEFYGKIITTRTFAERLQTLERVRAAGIKVCSGGILGLGETDEDRVGLLFELARQEPQPESVPINALVAMPGTPLEDRPPVAWDAMVRTVATARILMPRTKVRLSAGRGAMHEAAQAMCFLAGANSIFLGEKLLTTANRGPDQDAELLGKLGLKPSARVDE